MCGRYVTCDQAAIEHYLNLKQHQYKLTDRYNVVRTTPVPAVPDMYWSLIPPWSKDRKIDYKTFNARAESLATKPAFRAAYKACRCVIPAPDFYEWERDVEFKQFYWRSINLQCS